MTRVNWRSSAQRLIDVLLTSGLVVFSMKSSFEVYFDVPEADVAFDLPVQVDVVSLDRSAHLVDPDVEVADGCLLDALLDLLTLDALLIVCEVHMQEICGDSILFSAVDVVCSS